MSASIDSMTRGAGIPAGSTETSETCFPTSWTTGLPARYSPIGVADDERKALRRRRKDSALYPQESGCLLNTLTEAAGHIRERRDNNVSHAVIVQVPRRLETVFEDLGQPAASRERHKAVPHVTWGATPSSWRNRPLEPPSSATVTTAVRSPTLSLKPLSKTGSPVPPPNATSLVSSTLFTHLEYTHFLVSSGRRSARGRALR